MVKTKLKDLVLYSSALCNLTCRYCYVAKNQYLKEIDDAIAESFRTTEYYLNFLNNISDFFELDELDRISFWGSEPSLGYSRVSDTVLEIAKKYSTVNKLMASSNLTTDCFIDGFFEIINKISTLDRKFTFSQQVSIDGPEFINDANRGIGTTSKIIKNFDKLLESFSHTSENIYLSLHFKPTLSLDQLKNMKTKQDIIDYFMFFKENFYDKVEELNNPRISNGHAVISLVSPSNYTTEDGLFYAEFCRLCKEVDNSGELKHMRATPNYRLPRRCINYTSSSYKCKGGFCGLGIDNIGLLPNDYICMCHRSFGSFCENYNNVASSFENGLVNNNIFEANGRAGQAIFKYTESPKVLELYRYFYTDNQTTTMTSLATLIRVLACSGQILPKYKDETMALKAAKQYQKLYGICAKDCIDITGTLSSSALCGLRLILNGALDVLSEGTAYES